jgi:hypothetical protein
METTAGAIHDAYRGVKEILEGVKERTIPQLGKYRLAKLHRILEKQYTAIEDKRAALIQTLGEERFFDAEKTQSRGWGIDEQGPNMVKYVEEWSKVREEVVTIDTNPIPLAALGDNADNGLKLVELRLLDQFIEG